MLQNDNVQEKYNPTFQQDAVVHLTYTFLVRDNLISTFHRVAYEHNYLNIKLSVHPLAFIKNIERAKPLSAVPYKNPVL